MHLFLSKIEFAIRKSVSSIEMTRMTYLEFHFFCLLRGILFGVVYYGKHFIRGVATGRAWGSQAPPDSPYTFLGTSRFRKILTLALWNRPSQTSGLAPSYASLPVAGPRAQIFCGDAPAHHSIAVGIFVSTDIFRNPQGLLNSTSAVWRKFEHDS